MDRVQKLKYEKSMEGYFHDNKVYDLICWLTFQISYFIGIPIMTYWTYIVFSVSFNTKLKMPIPCQQDKLI